MKHPSMEEMIADCERMKKPDETIVFAIGAGRMIPKLGMKKIMEKTFEYIKGIDGFIGVHPIDLWHNLLLFDTLNHAKAAKNVLSSKGVPLGQIAPLMIPSVFVKGENDDTKDS